MKTKLALLLVVVTLLYSCERRIGECEKICYDIEKPANLKPIDWNGWNDAYTVYYNFYDNEEDACFDHDEDTIMCYGNLRVSHNNSDTDLEVKGGGTNLGILFCFYGSERDSLNYLLNNTSHSDTCFVKGILKLGSLDIMCCRIVSPIIIVNRIDDIYFK